MSYPVLLACAFVGGIVVMPAMAIGRQAMTALVPEDDRRTALSLDSIGVELTFMIAPAVAVVVCTQFSTVAALIARGCAPTAAGVRLYVAHPPVRGEHEQDAETPPRRSWLTPKFIAVLIGAVGVVFVLWGHEVAPGGGRRGPGPLAW